MTKLSNMVTRVTQSVPLVAASDIRFHKDGKKAVCKAGEPVADLPGAVYDQAEAAGQICTADEFKRAEEGRVKPWHEITPTHFYLK